MSPGQKLPQLLTPEGRELEDILGAPTVSVLCRGPQERSAVRDGGLSVALLPVSVGHSSAPIARSGGWAAPPLGWVGGWGRG